MLRSENKSINHKITVCQSKSPHLQIPSPCFWIREIDPKDPTESSNPSKSPLLNSQKLPGGRIWTDILWYQTHQLFSPNTFSLQSCLRSWSFTQFLCSGFWGCLKSVTKKLILIEISKVCMFVSRVLSSLWNPKTKIWIIQKKRVPPKFSLQWFLSFQNQS